MRGVDWALYAAWCEATGRDPLQASAHLDAYEAATPASPSVQRRRRAAIRAALHPQGGVTLQPAPAATAARCAPGWLPLDDALRALPTGNQPEAAAARRDALVLILLGPLRRTKAQARAARARLSPTPGLNGVELDFVADPTVCPTCALTRWLRVLAHARLGAEDDPYATESAGGHDCHIDVPDGWQHGPLLVPVRSTGTVEAFGRALSTRELSRITARRHHPELRPAPPPTTPAEPAPLPATMSPLEAALRRRALRRELQSLDD